MAAPAKIVFEVHAKAMRSREARVLLSNACAFFNEKLQEADPGSQSIRDPVRDFSDGVMLWMLLEALEGVSLGNYNPTAASDRGKLENIRGALAVMETLGIKPLADGVWTAEGILEENALHAWSLMTSIALHYNCNRELAPGSFLPVAEKHFASEDDSVPFVEKTRKFILVPDES